MRQNIHRFLLHVAFAAWAAMLTAAGEYVGLPGLTPEQQAVVVVIVSAAASFVRSKGAVVR